MEIKIWGASDDLIEVDGAADGCDEYYGGEEPRRVVCFPSMDVFRIQYGDPKNEARAVWTVEHEVDTGALRVRIDRAPAGDDPDPYTDTAHVSGPISRVEVWDTWPPTPQQIRTCVERMIEDSRGWTDEQVKAVFEALR